MQFNIDKIRQDFPALHQVVNNHPLVYLDSAASAHKPLAVIEAEQNFYRNDNSNVHRGVHALSQRADKAYKNARKTVQKFINAKHFEEVVFVRGSTEGINLIANALSALVLKENDEIIISAMEHHANIVPWQVACAQTGAKLRIIPVNAQGECDLLAFKDLLNSRTKLLAITHISNSLGTINPVAEMIALAQQHGALTLIDAAQSAPHIPVDVQQLNCDFLVFSGHKLYGPTGIGVLYGKREWLEQMSPYQTGGGMISIVDFNNTTYADLPYKFEAGTPHIAGAIGLAAAIDYLNQIGWDNIQAYEEQVFHSAGEKLANVPGLHFIGNAKHKIAVHAFVVENIHPHDLGTILDQYGVAIRAGHHCTMPLMKRFDVVATARASFGIYNTVEEVDILIDALYHAKRLFA